MVVCALDRGHDHSLIRQEPVSPKSGFASFEVGYPQPCACSLRAEWPLSPWSQISFEASVGVGDSPLQTKRPSLSNLHSASWSSKIRDMENRTGELVFEVLQEQDGGFVAECLSESIVTEADSWEELRKNVMEAVSAFFFDDTPPAQVRLHLVRDEILTVA